MRKYTVIRVFSLRKKCVFLIPTKFLCGWVEPGQREQKNLYQAIEGGNGGGTSTFTLCASFLKVRI